MGLDRGHAGMIGVVGLGLIGGSVARTLVAAGVDVVAWDPHEGTLTAAAAVGIRTLESVEAVCAERPSVLVVAVPLVVVPQTARALARCVDPTTTITDVGSVKGPVREAMVAAGLGQQFVGAHPMAGTEHSGFGASDADLLRGVRWAVTLDEDTSYERFVQVVRMVVDVFDGVVHPLSDAVHDEAAALVSHVPHVLATELLNVVAHSPISSVALGLAAGSFRDGTRVARTDPARTEAMVVDNAGWVAPALRVVARDLERLADTLESNGSSTEFFVAADALRAGGGELPAEAVRSLDDPPVDGWQSELVGLGARGGRITAIDAHGALVVVEPQA